MNLERINELKDDIEKRKEEILNATKHIIKAVALAKDF